MPPRDIAIARVVSPRFPALMTNRRFPILTLFLFAAAALATAGDQTTSATLSLDALFRPAPPPDAAHVERPRPTPANREAPAAEPAPEPQQADSTDSESGYQHLKIDGPLPWIPPRGFTLRNRPIQIMRGGLNEIGRDITLNEPYARVTAANQFRTLCTRIELISADNSEGQLTFLLGPEFSEELLLPPGEWRVVRTVWRIEEREPELREEFQSQHLRRGWKYDFNLNEREESRLLRELGQQRRRNRHSVTIR